MRRILNSKRYKLDQIIMACLCPDNRDAVRRKFSCDDRGLIDHPEDLVMQFVDSGGAKEFAKKKESYKRDVYDESDIEYMI